MGSLGGGNHFIEIAQGTEHAFLCIHSGSRNFGLKIAERYQKMAVAACPDTHLKERKKGLCYLEGENTLNYIRDMKVAQRFAALNRRVMLRELVDVRTPWKASIPCITTLRKTTSSARGLYGLLPETGSSSP